MGLPISPPSFAPVAPPHILSQLLERGPNNFGLYHLWLAHLTVERKKEFQQLLNQWNQQRHPKDLTIIMDNSIVELGGSVDDDMIAAACNIAETFPGSVIPVLPDVMGNGEDTIILASKGYQRWVHLETVPCPDGVMLVTQGDNYKDFVNLVNYFFITHATEHKGITWVGIPRVLVRNLGGRMRAIQYLKTVAPHVKIHLLGFSGNIYDDLICAALGTIYGARIMGIDSAVPVRYNGVLTPQTTEEEIGQRGSWMEDGQLNHQNMQNITNVRTWIGSNQ